jgi:hypothetical protein
MNMANYFSIMKSALRILLPIPALLSLVSWSPTDPTVIIGAGNDIDGYIGTSPTSNITEFRGFLSGTNNVAGSTNTSSYYAAVIGNSNKANLYSSVLAGDWRLQRILRFLPPSSAVQEFLATAMFCPMDVRIYSYQALEILLLPIRLSLPVPPIPWEALL